MKQTKNKKLRILAIGAVTFFSLCANILATVAWFTANRNTEQENDYFGVQDSGSAVIDHINLYKFNYNVTTVGEGENAFENIEYLNPETGEVKRYSFNTEQQKFGEFITNPDTQEEEFVETTVMNVYDPIEKVIQQENFKLFNMNCNVVYEIVFTSTSFTTCYMDVISSLITKSKTSNQIYLSDCVDFDVFYASDLSDASLANKAYYPTYKTKDPSKTEDQELTAEEILYYKFAYLSSRKLTHPHFYTDGVKPESITLESNKQITFTNNTFTLYINANYCPEQLEKYQEKIYLSNILAVYDFSISTRFDEDSGE